MMRFGNCWISIKNSEIFVIGLEFDWSLSRVILEGFVDI